MKEYSVNCDIARDLMPLVIDEAASEAAREAVNGHVEGCAACRAVMDNMKRESALAVQPTQAGEQETRFIQFCRRMEKRFTLRRALITVLAALLLSAVVTGGWSFVVYKVDSASAYMKFTEADVGGKVQLVQNQFGRVSLRIEADDERHPYIGTEGHTELKNGRVIIFDSPKTCAWPHVFGASYLTEPVYDDLFNLRIEDDSLVMAEYESFTEFEESGEVVTRSRVLESVPVEELWLGHGDDALLLWQAGDPVAFPVVEEAPSGIDG